MNKETVMIKIIMKFGYRKEIPPIAYDHIKKKVIMGIRRLDACKQLGVQPNIVDGLGRNYKLDESGAIVPDFKKKNSFKNEC